MFRKDGLFEKIALKYDLSRIVWKDGIFFPRKHDSFPFFDLSQEIHVNMIFSVSTCRCYEHDATTPCQKKSRMILLRKNTPKGD